MIVLRVVRVEDDGAETELGEVRLTEVGVVYSHLSTAAGEGVMRDLRERLRGPVDCAPHIEADAPSGCRPCGCNRVYCGSCFWRGRAGGLA